MTRVVYVFWLLLAALLFTLALLFVLANPEPVTLNLLMPFTLFEMRLGVLVLAALLVGLALGLVGGYGVRHLLQLIRRRA